MLLTAVILYKTPEWATRNWEQEHAHTWFKNVFFIFGLIEIPTLALFLWLFLRRFLQQGRKETRSNSGMRGRFTRSNSNGSALAGGSSDSAGGGNDEVGKRTQVLRYLAVRTFAVYLCYCLSWSAFWVNYRVFSTKEEKNHSYLYPRSQILTLLVFVTAALGINISHRDDLIIQRQLLLKCSRRKEDAKASTDVVVQQTNAFLWQPMAGGPEALSNPLLLEVEAPSITSSQFQMTESMPSSLSISCSRNTIHDRFLRQSSDVSIFMEKVHQEYGEEEQAASSESNTIRVNRLLDKSQRAMGNDEEKISC